MIFPVHKDIEIWEKEPETLRITRVKEGDIKSDTLVSMYSIPLSLEEMKELSHELAQYFKTPEPEIVFTNKYETDRLGRPVNGICDWTVRALIFNKTGEDVGTLIHEFSHWIVYWIEPTPAGPAHGREFEEAQKQILQCPVLYDYLRKKGKTQYIECTLTKEGEEYMRRLGRL
jgi:hypothetical protein